MGKFGIDYIKRHLYYGFRKKIIMKFAYLISKAKKLGLLENYGQKSFIKTRKRPSLDYFINTNFLFKKAGKNL